jgi:hypothetical protein
MSAWPCCDASARARCRSSRLAIASITCVSATRPNPAAAASVSTWAPRRTSASAAITNPKASAVISGEFQSPHPAASTAAPKSTSVSTSGTCTPARAG